MNRPAMNHSGVPRRAGGWRAVPFVVVVAAGVGVWFYLHRTRPAAVPPAVPDRVADPAVREALTGARDDVLRTPHSGPAWGDLGLVFRAHGLAPESNACFAEAARLDPADPRWPYLIGLINLLAAPDDALPHLRAAYRLAPAGEYRSAARLRLAEALAERGEPAEAAALFEDELRDQPAARAHFNLGVLAQARGDDAAAVRHLEAAAASPFARKKAAALLAAAHHRLGDADAAARWTRAAAAAPPDLVWADPFITEYMRRETGRSAKVRMVEGLEAQGRLVEALAILEDLAAADPTDQEFVNLGIVLAKTGEHDRAERTLRAALELNPDHAFGRYFLGIALYTQGEGAAAGGDQARAAGKFEEAVVQLRRSTARKPDLGKGYLYAGFALRRLGRLAEAADACRDAVRVAPDQATNHRGLGEILLEMGRPAEAIAPLEEAARLSPGDTRAADLLAKARAAAKKGGLPEMKPAPGGRSGGTRSSGAGGYQSLPRTCPSFGLQA